MFTEKDFQDVKMFFNLAYEQLFETVPISILGQKYRRMNEIEAILYDYINKEPNTEESPD